MARVDYRESHASEDTAAGYVKTYAAGYYAAQWRDLERPLLGKLFRELADCGKKSLLDLACGQGRITLLGARHFEHVTGFDFSPEMLVVAREAYTADKSLSETDVDFQEGDVSDYSVERPVDVITAFRFFLNSEDALRVEGLRCVHRNLKPDGTLITNIHVSATSPLSVFYRAAHTADWALGRSSNRVRNYMSLGDFSHLLSSEGFEIDSVYRYSILPRIGTLTDPFAEKNISKVDAWVSWIPGMKLLGQSFLVCARPM